MNKFKFGDKVIYQTCLYVVTAAVDDECFLISEGSYGAGIWADASKLTPATDWVKCSERMPEPHEAVLVHYEDGSMSDDYSIERKGQRIWNCISTEDATHWMPLPAPPTEVEQ